jgi:DNA-binding transcriptional regulator YiaG
MTLAAALKDAIRRASARETQKTMRRLRRMQRQVKALRQEARAQRRIVAGVERRFARLKTRVLRTGVSAGPGRPLTPQSIRSLRERLGMPRIRFAKLLGVSPGSIFGWETGRTLPRGRSVARLRDVRKMGLRAARGAAGGGRRSAGRRKAGRRRAARRPKRR